MSLPGGIRTRIVLVLVGIVAGALGTAYMIVVPSLERRLVDARLKQLAQLGTPLARKLPEDTLLWQDRVESFGVETNSRVVAFSVLSKTQPALVVVADSRTRSSRDVQRDPIARAAMMSGKTEQGRVDPGAGDYAEVAIPVGPEAVLLFQGALADSLATVEIVREYEPDRSKTDVYDDFFGIYRELREATINSWDKLQAATRRAAAL